MKKIGVMALVLLNLAVILLTVYFIWYFYNVINYIYYKAPTPIINYVFLDNFNNINISYKVDERNLRSKMYFLYKTDSTIPSISDERWQEVSDNKVSFKLDKNIYYAFFKNEDNEIFKINNVDTIGKVTELKVNKDKVYLAINGEYDLKAVWDSIGNVQDNLTWTSEDGNIASIDQNGHIKGLKSGKTKITAKIMNESVDTEVIVTDLITLRPNSYNSKKPYLSCGRYNKEENDLLDEILKARIDDVGYKTRAGAVEAARFLALEFPYKIRYFSENGRGSTNGVDGEGRYYHVGLYLNSSRFDNISYSIKSPQIWGCLLYSNPVKKEEYNGLDCSGFVSWALLNGGFDVEDVGAGWSDEEDLTDFGEVKLINDELIKSNSIKVGDLLHSEASGGHIGIIVGDDGDNYYVAQAIWYDTVGVIITKIKKEKLSSSFPHVVLMDKYYIEDGNLTNMW